MSLDGADLLASAFERADGITKRLRGLPTSATELREHLGAALTEAKITREALEADLRGLPQSRRDAVLLLLQHELTETLRLYRLALSSETSLRQRQMAIDTGDRQQFELAVRETIRAAEVYLRSAA